METCIGTVSHYYPKVGVAAVILDNHVQNGDTIRIRGPHEDFVQQVTSMEIDHRHITEAESGQDIGIRVIQRVHEGDRVYRES